MDFFEHQDVARKRSGRLVLLFGAAVAGIILLTYLVVAGAAAIIMGSQTQPGEPAADPLVMLLNPLLFVAVAGGVVLVVGGASLTKLASLRGGGQVVARSLGGKLLTQDTRDPDERKILNVVQEMAIASGVPVPPVYLMEDEPAINAFAAGYHPDDAVIGVTRGCVQQLSRDELQGVMAHEFSHILNGDMRLNIRLIGVIFGILVIGLTGQTILRGVFYSGGTRRRSSNDKGGGAVIVIAGAALLLMLIGYIGMFFGQLIKSAVSRQREYLADASAVQFTRNPDGISGALKRIGGLSSHGAIRHPKAEEFSHMYFAEGVSHWLGNAMATHPPLAERIRRIEPRWDGGFEEPRDTPERAARRQRRSEAAMGLAGADTVGGSMADPLSAQRDAAAQTQVSTPAAVDSIGAVTPAHIAVARALLTSIPEPLRDAAHAMDTARPAVFALLLDDDDTVQQKQLALLGDEAEETLALRPAAQALPTEARLSLLDLLIPTLRGMDRRRYDVFKHTVEQLMGADQRLDLFEWTLQRVLLRHVEATYQRARPPQVTVRNMSQAQAHAVLLLSALSYIGSRSAETAADAFAAGYAETALQGDALLSKQAVSLPNLSDALDALHDAAPAVKRRVIHACAKTIAADGEVTAREAELMRAIADGLDAPMPPLLPGQALV